MSSVFDVPLCAARGGAVSIATARTGRKSLDTRITYLLNLRLARSGMEHYILVGQGRSKRVPQQMNSYPYADYPAGPGL